MLLAVPKYEYADGVKSLRAEIKLLSIRRFLLLYYKNQSVNAVYGNSLCSQIHKKHINTLCGQNAELLKVKLVVHIVTNGL